MMSRAITALSASLILAACQLSTPPDVQTLDCDNDPLCGPITARGQEPGWLLKVDKNQIDLLYQYGEKEFQAPTPRPQAIDKGIHYQVQTDDGHELQIDLTRKHCADIATGMPHPYTARLHIDGQTYDGCAGEPQQLLVGGEWTVDSIDDTTVRKDSRITLRFTKDGTLHGHAGCNQFSGQYELTGEGIRTSELVRTEKACSEALMRQEEALLEVIRNMRWFRSGEEGELELNGVEGQRLQAHR